MKTVQYGCVLAVLLLFRFTSSAADLDFYGRFLSLADTNDWRAQGVTNALLVNVTNKVPKLTNSIISLQKLRSDGEVGSVRLGMTMEEVVSRWGKPIWLHPQCDGGHKFNFSDCQLVFAGNSLNKIKLPNSAVFDHGLSARSDLEAWRRVLGTPTVVNKGMYGITMAYEHIGTVRTVLVITFEPDGEVRIPPAVYLDPPLTNWFQKPKLANP